MGLTQAQLIAAIGKKIYTPKKWYVGITEDPKERRVGHGNPSAWYDWEGESEDAARGAEKHWLDKGCQGGPKGGDHPHWVYIYMV